MTKKKKKKKTNPRKLTISSIDKDREQLEMSDIAGRIVKGHNYGKQFCSFLRRYTGILYDPVIS
jgi:hypothetical protein